MEFTLGLNKLPFVQIEKQILYTEGSYDKAVNDYICKNYDSICAYCAQRGYEFCYLPKLSMEVATSEAAFYHAPYFNKADYKTISSDSLLDYMARPENKEKVPPSLLYVQPRNLYSNEEREDKYLYRGVALTPDSGYDQSDNLSTILEGIIDKLDKWSFEGGISCCFGEDDDFVEKQRKAKHASIFDQIGRYRKELEDLIQEDSPQKGVGDEGVSEICEADRLFDSESIRLAKEIIYRIHLLELRGIKRYALEQFIHEHEKLSRLVITKDYRIFLPDYNNIEIEMTPLPKALYLLFLRHHRGIFFKCLPDFRQELMEIYKELKPSSDSTASQRSIEDVTDPTKNSINENCARIRAAFISKFEKHLAENYYITGRRGELKRITLPRHLIIWEEPFI